MERHVQLAGPDARGGKADAPHLLHGWEGSGPPLGELLHGDAPAESRLPLR